MNLNTKYWFVVFFITFLSSALFTQEAILKGDEFYYKGKKVFRKANYNKAFKLFTKAYEVYEEEKAPEFKLIKTLYRQADCKGVLRINQVALDINKRALTMLDVPIDDETLDMYALLLEQRGNLLNQIFEPKQAMASYNKAIGAFTEAFGAESSQVGNCLMNIGTSLDKDGRYMEALDYYQRAFAIFKKTSKPESVNFNRIYSNMGTCFRSIGDYEKAIRYGEKALEIKLKNYPANHPSIGKYYRNLSKVYSDLGEYEKALPLQKKAEQIARKAYGKNHFKTAGEIGETAIIYDYLGQKEKALGMYRKVHEIRSKSIDPTHPYLLATVANIGSVYMDMGNHEKAIEKLKEAHSNIGNRRSQAAYYSLGFLIQISKNFRIKNELDSALFYCQKAFVELDSSFESRSHNFRNNPTEKPNRFESNFFQILKLKASIFEQIAAPYIYNENGQIDTVNGLKYLKESMFLLDFAIETMEKARKIHQSEDTRLFLNKYAESYYKQAVRLAFILEQLTGDPKYLMKALNYMDKGKAAVMRQSLNSAFALKTADIPKSFIEKLDALNAEISILKNSADLSAEEEKRNFDLQLEYEELVIGLENKFPEYYALKYSNKNLDFNAIQSRLKSSNGALISYMIIDSVLYGLLVTPDGIHPLKSKFGVPEKLAIKTIAKFNPDALFTTRKDSIELAYYNACAQLYQKLIEPFGKVLNACTNLQIVPHGKLYYLPFEVLLEDAPLASKKKTFLIQKHALFYQWSISLWIEGERSDKGFSKRLATFAPLFEKELIATRADDEMKTFRDGFAALPFTKKESEAALSFFKGTAFLGRAATESEFKKVGESYGMLHLATHAAINDFLPMQSGFLFSEIDTSNDAFLSLAEIYQMRFNTELAVLSACNTGAGKIADGEGVLSLGRGFRYAGCNSVLMSLWLANDRSTAKIMEVFYEKLHEGLSKDEALRQAKLSFLNEADALNSHPYYWAGIVGFGAESPIDNTLKLDGFVWLVVVLIGFWVFWILRKKYDSSF